MGKLVSIIIPSYERDGKLVRAIDSALTQTYENIEIIIINDNPESSKYKQLARDIASAYMKKSDKVSYVENENNLGGAETRNVGIRVAKGEYIAFLDDDDEILSDKIEEQVSLFEKTDETDLALVYCYSKTIFDDANQNEVIYTKNDFRGICIKDMLIDGTIAATTQWLCRRDYLLAVGGFENVPSKQDSTLILKLLENGYAIDRVPKVLSLYHVQRKGSISTSLKSIEGEMRYRIYCRKFYHLLDFKDILNVEYSFSKRLLDKYMSRNMYREAWEMFNTMKSIKPREAIQRLIYIILFNIKHKLLLKE